MSTSMIVTGVLAVIAGIIALAWPSVTVLALVILFAVYAFSDSAVQGMRAISSGSAGPVTGHLLLGLIDIAAGLVAIIWPGPTALVLVPRRRRLTLALLFGLFALIYGISQVSTGIQLRQGGATVRPVLRNAA
jgi:uncharacterized membrane protein HdeD (DUF308 family)